MTLGRQITVVLVFALALGGAAYWYADYFPSNGDAGAETRPTRPPARVEVVEATRSIMVQQVEAVGTTLARRAVDIRPATSGQIVEIAFSPGSLIEAGSLLARLDDAAEKADVAEAAADLRQARLELERATKLVERNTIAQATVDQLEAARQAAEARLQRTQKALDDRVIRAPFAGQVGLKQVNLGSRVNDETVITTLDDLEEIEIEFNVTEIFFGKVGISQKIEATSAAYDDRVFEGVIDSVDSRIDRSSRAFRVRAHIPNPDLALPSGMFMLVKLTLQERDVLTVPEEAIMVADDAAYVFVIEDGKARQNLVELGQRSLGTVEITEGLAEGSTIVTKGLQRIRNGSPVNVAEDGEPSADGGNEPRGARNLAEPSA